MATHNGPESRLAQYLAKIAGEDVPTPKPSTEAEIYLNKIAQSGGGSGGGGVFVVNVTSENLADVSTYIFDKTFAEMKEAAVAGKTIIASFEHENSLVTYDPGGPDEEGEEFPEAIYAGLTVIRQTTGNKLLVGSFTITLLSDETYDNFGAMKEYQMTPAT